MSLKISRILHAGYVFECEGTQIAFDPIFENPFSRNCYAFPSIEFDLEQIKKLKFSAVFISHYHDDHCSFESLNLLDRNTPIYVYCIFEELFSLIRHLGFVNVYSLEINGLINIGAFEITPRRALDADVDSIFQIKAGGINVLNVVDSWIDEDTLNQLSKNSCWDVILWPFQTMREIEVIAPSRAYPAPAELPQEWIDQLKILNPKYVVPSSCQFIQESWSWYNHAFFPISYKQFEKEIKIALPDSKVVRLNPSVSVLVEKHSIQIASPLSWIKTVGDQDVDYDYRPNVKPPTTEEISKHFAPLSSQQSKKVFDYCNDGLMQKFRSMEPPVDIYFEKTRLWQLSIYDHNGQPTHFMYEIDGSKINLLTNGKERPISWLTQVPISKLYAALELGESLTSMYVRVNDMIFDPEIEKEINDADIVDDPLIRCLFNGVFGAYQKAQLKRISESKLS